MERDPSLLLWDAKRSAETILRFTTGLSFEDDEAGEMIRSAVERQFEILGEALNRLRRAEPQTAARTSGLRGAVALRNVPSHGYGTVDDGTVWTIIRHDVPALLGELTALLGRG